MKIRWKKTAPTKQGWYWHWNGDFDSGPFPMYVLWSGTSNKCFVDARCSVGNELIIDCDKYGGQWREIPEPALPTKGKRG